LITVERFTSLHLLTACRWIQNFIEALSGFVEATAESSREIMGTKFGIYEKYLKTESAATDDAA
jgi:hypothetical protein